MQRRDIAVVKLGGAAGIDIGCFCADVAAIVRAGRQLVIVHGGSHQTTVLQESLGHPPQFITSPSGHTSRRTDRRTLEIFQMACRGILNQQLVERLQSLGVNAVGISGMDGRTWEGTRKSTIRAMIEGRTTIVRDDFTGTVDRVNLGLVEAILNAGMVPVLSPPAISTEHEPINVDADRAAAVTASALGAHSLLLLSNVKGLLRAFPDESTLVEHVDRRAIQDALELAQGRMKKKVLGAEEALRGGVDSVVIADARGDAPISRALAGQGTTFR